MIGNSGLVAWQALVIVAGGIVAASVALSVLAKVPGGRWLFARLVADPLREVVREVLESDVSDVVDEEISTRLADVGDRLTDLAAAVEQVNVAVNHVTPGTPPLKDRVAGLEAGQGRIEGQLSVIRDVMERLVSRP